MKDYNQEKNQSVEIGHPPPKKKKKETEIMDLADKDFGTVISSISKLKDFTEP